MSRKVHWTREASKEGGENVQDDSGVVGEAEKAEEEGEGREDVEGHDRNIFT